MAFGVESHLRPSLIVSIFALALAQSIQCPTVTNTITAYITTTGKCYFATASAFAGSDVGAACFANHPSAIPATFSTTAEANAVIDNSCATSNSSTILWNGLYNASMATGGNSGWEFRTSSISAAWFLGNGTAYWAEYFPDIDNGYCVFATSGTLQNADCAVSLPVCCEMPPMATPSLTPSRSPSPTGSASKSESVSGTSSRSPTKTNSQTASNTQSSSTSRTQTATSTPSRSGSMTGTATPSLTATVSSSQTMSPSDTASSTSSRTGSKTMTGTSSPSVTGTGTASVSASVTPSQTSSNTGTQTPSVTPSKTGTPSQTPSPSVSASVTASTSVTASPTPSNTATQSMTTTPSNTASNTASVTPSETASETPSVTITSTSSQTPSETSTQTSTPSTSNTATETASPTATVTPSNTITSTSTPSQTMTQSPSMSSSVTASSSRTMTQTSTSSITASPSTSPYPLEVLSFTQELIDADDSSKIGLLTMYGRGYRFYEENSDPMLEAEYNSCTNITKVNATTFTARCHPAFVLWVHTTITVRVKSHRAVFLKPALAVSIETTPQCGTDVVTLNTPFRISAPWLSNAPVLSAELGQSLGEPPKINKTTGPEGPITLKSTVISAMPIGGVGDDVFLVVKMAPEAMFFQPLPVTAVFNGYGMLLECTISLIKPALLPLHATMSAMHPKLQFPVTLHPSVGPKVGPSRSWLATTAVSSMLSLERNTIYATGGHVLDSVMPTSMKLNGLTLRSSVTSVAPVLLSVSPDVVQWDDVNGIAGFEILVTGRRFLIGEETAITQLFVSNIGCSATNVLNTTHASCVLAVVQIPELDRIPLIKLHITASWGVGSVISGPSLTVVKKPVVNAVFPRLVEPGTRLVVHGFNFLVEACPYCRVGSAVEIIVGNTPCIKTIALSPSTATCIVPLLPLDFPGYPQANVSAINPAGFYSFNAVSATFVSKVQISWNMDVVSTAAVAQLPSGMSEAFHISVSPALSLLLSGYGSVQCWIDADTDTPGEIQVTGKSSIVTTVGINGETSKEIVFAQAGLRVRSNTTVLLRAYCVDSNAFRLSTPSTVAVSFPPWVSTWAPATAEAAMLLLQRPDIMHEVAASITIFHNALAAARIPFLFECSAAIFARNRVVQPQVQPFSSISGQLASVQGVIQEAYTTSTGKSQWSVKFGSIKLDQLAPGKDYNLVTQCQWLPTKELVAAPVLPFTVANLSLLWTLTPTLTEHLGVHHAFLRKTYATDVEIIHSIPEVLFMGSVAECRFVRLSSTDLALTSESTISVTIPMSRTMKAAMPLRVDGLLTGKLTVLMECLLLGRQLRSAEIVVQARSVQMKNTTSLPSVVFVADSHAPVPIYPPVLFQLIDSIGMVAGDAVCFLATTFRGVRIRMGNQDAQTQVSESGVIHFQDAGIVAQGIDFILPTALDLQVSCDRNLRDDPVPVAWQVRVMQMDVMLTSALPTATDEIGRMDTISVQIIPSNMSLLDISEFSVQIFQAAKADNAVLCAIDMDASKDTVDGRVFAYVQRGRSTMNETGGVTFKDPILVGQHGLEHGVVLRCGLGSIDFGKVLRFSVRVPFCPAGTRPLTFGCNLCEEGSFSLGDSAKECTQCPKVGVKCENGILSLLPNFYRDPSENGEPIGPATSLYTCYNLQSCIVNTTSLDYTCAPGYSGPLCGVCDARQGYAAFGPICARCWPAPVGWGIVGGTIALIIIILCIFALRKKFAQRSDLSIVARITISYLQALNSLQTFKAGGTPLFRSLMSWSIVLSDSPLTTGPSQCVLRWSFLVKYLSIVAIPVVAGVGVVAVVVVALCFRAIRCRPRIGWKNEVFSGGWELWLEQRRFVATMVMFSVLFYMPIVGASFRVLGCYDRPIAGKYWVASDLSLECDSKEHITAQLVSAAVLICFGLGFPVGLYFMLSGASHANIYEKRFQHAFSFLYGGYKTGDERCSERASQRLIWWESVVLLRKAGIVCVAVLVKNAYYQVVTSVLLFAVFTLLQQQFMPYTRSLFNLLEFASLFVLFCTAAISGVLLRSLDGEGKPAELDSVASITTTIILLAINAIVLVMLLGTVLVFLYRKFSRVREKKKRWPSPLAKNPADVDWLRANSVEDGQEINDDRQSRVSLSFPVASMHKQKRLGSMLRPHSERQPRGSVSSSLVSMHRQKQKRLGSMFAPTMASVPTTNGQVVTSQHNPLLAVRKQNRVSVVSTPAKHVEPWMPSQTDIEAASPIGTKDAVDSCRARKSLVPNSHDVVQHFAPFAHHQRLGSLFQPQPNIPDGVASQIATPASRARSTKSVSPGPTGSRRRVASIFQAAPARGINSTDLQLPFRGLRRSVVVSSAPGPWVGKHSLASLLTATASGAELGMLPPAMRQGADMARFPPDEEGKAPAVPTTGATATANTQARKRRIASIFVAPSK